MDFKDTKIYLNIKDFKLEVKLQNPKILIKNNDIKLSKFDLYLPLKSFYTSDFILEKANLEFQQNDIKDLIKISSIFLPRFLNKKLDKIFIKGNLEGDLTVPFTQKGSISKDYKFNLRILESNIRLNKDFELKNFTANLTYGEKSTTERLKIKIKNGNISNLELLESFIDVSFKENYKNIKSSFHTKGKINFLEIKKIANLLDVKLNYFDNIIVNSDLISNLNFNLSDNLKIKNINYSSKGEIGDLRLKIKEQKKINKYLKNFNQDIIFKNAKMDFNHTLSGNESLKLDGKVKFGDKFENIKIEKYYDKSKKKHKVNTSFSLKSSFINIPNINYKKIKGIDANISFYAEIINDKMLSINNLNYVSEKNKIFLKNVKLNKKLEIIDLEEIKIKTYLKNSINNDFTVKKSDKIIVKGEFYDSQYLLKSLYQKNSKKTFAKNFSSSIVVNFKNILTGTNDNLSNFTMIALIDEGAYKKLSLKGNFSKDEILEMSIYHDENNKKTLKVFSDRARPFMKNFNFIKGFEGGKLEYESSTTNNKSISNLILTDFKVSRVPTLAKLLTLASLRGIADTLDGEGIHFDSFEMKSNTEGNILSIEDALAMGPAVSILLDGYVDKGKTVSLRGTLVPATMLNSVIASIPLVGNILVGKKTGDGVVGVSFKMKGPPKKIKTTVNPIKTLTPRFIVRAVEKITRKKKENSK